MTYEETKQLEENVKITKEAEETYKKFLKNIKLKPENYIGNGKFLHWKDKYNATYFIVEDNFFIYECKFLHESYTIKITPSDLFDYIKNKYRGYEHLKSAVRDK